MAELCRFYGWAPSEVWALTYYEYEVFRGVMNAALEQQSGGGQHRGS